MSKKPRIRPEQVPIPARPPTEPEPSESTVTSEVLKAETPPEESTQELLMVS
jgi:hypothetical protein